jgi:hypothetical protein
MKAGIDLLHSRYDGTSASRPVLVADSNRTLVRRLDFDAPAGRGCRRPISRCSRRIDSSPAAAGTSSSVDASIAMASWIA